MDNQEVVVSLYPIQRKVLRYWKKTHNGSLFSHLLFWLCIALEVAINRFGHLVMNQASAETPLLPEVSGSLLLAQSW